MPRIKEAKDAYRILMAEWDENRIELIEDFNVLLLNADNRVLGIHRLSTGGSCSTVADTKIIYMGALLTNASSIILAHNHPGGNLAPSKEDIQLTEKIRKAGELFDIKVFDHLIVSSDGFYSLANDRTYENFKSVQP